MNKKIFAFTLLITFIFANFILPCEKAISAAQVRYWICGQCGKKTKTLKGYIPKNGDILKGECFHSWEEVDYRTWVFW